MRQILPVVEGDGDLAAVPELMRRILQDCGQFDVQVCRAHRRGDLPKVLGRFDDYFRTALLEGAPILWVMDCDCTTCNDQARDLQQLKQLAQNIDANAAVEFVFMVQEFETLFLADHETTRSVFSDIPSEFVFPPNPELIRDAKGLLSKARPKGSAYKPTQHQARLSAQLNLNRLRQRSASFQHFEAAVHRLLPGVE